MFLIIKAFFLIGIYGSFIVACCCQCKIIADRCWFLFVCHTIIGAQSVDFDEEIHCPNRCGRKYKHKGSVARHLKYECGVNPKFQCIICLKPFKQRINHKIHMIRIHNCVI